MTNTVNAAPVKKNKRNKVQVQERTPNYQAVEKLFNEGDLEGTKFSILRHDGTRKVQTINKHFLLTERNTKKSVTDIVKDLNAIVHDDGGYGFII